jgi:hypothetical protein
MGPKQQQRGSRSDSYAERIPDQSVNLLRFNAKLAMILGSKPLRVALQPPTIRILSFKCPWILLFNAIPLDCKPEGKHALNALNQAPAGATQTLRGSLQRMALVGAPMMTSTMGILMIYLLQAGVSSSPASSLLTNSLR